MKISHFSIDIERHLKDIGAWPPKGTKRPDNWPTKNKNVKA